MAKKPNPSVYLKLNPKVLAALIERNLSFMEGLLDDTRKEVIQVITDGLIKGDDIFKIRDKIRTVGFNEARAEAIARTEVMYSLNESAKDSYRESDIEYVKWLSSWDNRTCDDLDIELPDGSIAQLPDGTKGCAAMDGKIFKLDEAPDCPAHPQCRCSLSPSRGPEDY